MRGRKACRKCRYIVETRVNECPVCGSKEFTNRWTGFIIVIDTSTRLNNLISLEKEGIYAIRIM